MYRVLAMTDDGKSNIHQGDTIEPLVRQAVQEAVEYDGSLIGITLRIEEVKK